MTSNPTRQRQLRGHMPARPSPRTANSAAHQAALARRLTARDKWIIHMLAEHRVLTTTQITACAFPSGRAGRQRLRELFQWSVLDRFQPFVTVGTAPMHYVLAPAGAAVLAAEYGLDIKNLHYRRDRALGIAHSLRLAHTVGVNNWFTALITAARTHHPDNGAAVRAWWSETRCARHFGDLVQPDAYGRWYHHSGEVEFFLEYDTGTEPLTRVAAKLAGYAALAASTGITTPLLIWLPSSSREATARSLLARIWENLNDPATVPIATANPQLLDSTAAHPSPANPIWLPLDAAGHTGRIALHQLLGAWPYIPTPDPDGAATTNPPLTALPAPAPMPPDSA